MTVRQGAPAPLAQPFTAARITRYVTAAQRVARRVEVSLRRLTRYATASPAGKLAAQVADLRHLYAATPAVLSDPRTGRAVGEQIAAREGAVSALARQSGFPACAVG